MKHDKTNNPEKGLAITDKLIKEEFGYYEKLSKQEEKDIPIKAKQEINRRKKLMKQKQSTIKVASIPPKTITVNFNIDEIAWYNVMVNEVEKQCEKGHNYIEKQSVWGSCKHIPVRVMVRQIKIDHGKDITYNIIYYPEHEFSPGMVRLTKEDSFYKQTITEDKEFWVYGHELYKTEAECQKQCDKDNEY